MGVPGIDVPDSRESSGLDQVGRDLIGNPDVVVTDEALDLIADAKTVAA